MRKVAIIGIGQTPVREHWDYSIRQLGVQALAAAMKDAQVKQLDALYVGNMLSGALAEQEHLGALIADYVGLPGIEAVKIEAACASGGAAFRQAVLAVASGHVEVAAAVGVEKLTEFSGKFSGKALATAADADYEASIGLSFAALNALIMQRYMFEFKFDKEDFAVFPMLAHHNARFNPNAMFHYDISKQQYLKAKPIADPINLLDSSPISDGAAAVVVTSAEMAEKMAPPAVEVLACELATDTIGLDNRKELLRLEAAELSAQRAYAAARVSPREIDLFEMHDAFSIMSVLSLESCGFAERGQALKMAWDGAFNIDGALPVSTMGGLKGRGHPVGATGVYQIVEAALQLRGQAPEKLQVPGARTAMAQNIGGSGATIVTTILRK
ncbi:MAG TPA: thiolase domain-containing protein [Caldithrix abyssi]|uniref:Thiolase domain-containing protein n=1 Tax=Caldithrix abyssi TaxID=187145 RepID=A0A7V5PQU0_CALAY|nr:thiolase domain-containing protein [Caldithrix abyssi]